MKSYLSGLRSVACRRVRVGVTSVLIVSSSLSGQVGDTARPAAASNPASAPASSTDAKTGESDDSITLTPFDVVTTSDKSYGALNSNSITRFNTELAKLPVSADIYNEAFMRDINATNVEDMISQYTAGAGFASNDAAASSDASQPGERQANASVKLRGLT